MGATGLHLGSISPGRGARPLGTPWWARRAILDADFRENRFRFGGKTLTDQADFLAAAGGVEAGGSVLFGPYVVPKAPELIANGDFSAAGLAGWTPVLNGSSSAGSVGAAAQLTSDGSSGLGGGGAGITQPLATSEHRAYRATYTVSDATCNFRIGGTSATAAGPAGGTRSPGSYVDTFSARAGTSHFYAFRGPTGSTRVSNVSVRPCLPLKGMGDGGLTVEIVAEAPASTATRQVLWSCGHLMTADPGDEIQIVCQAGGELHVESRAATHLQASLNLGELEPGAPIVVRVGFAQEAFFAQLNDGVTVSHNSGVLVGLAVMRLGSNLAGESWGGEIHRLTVYGEGGAETFYGLVRNLIRCEGDAVLAGASAAAAIATVARRTTISTAEDGSTAANIGERIRASANAHLRPRTTVIWQAAAEAQSVPEVEDWCDALGAAVAELGHRRFVVIPALVDAGETELDIADATRDALAVRFPQNLLDWRDHLELDANGVPVQVMFEDPESGSLRLSEAATDLMASAIAGFIHAKGW